MFCKIVFKEQSCSDILNKMNITFDRLKYFLEVAKLEHVGLASKSLGISPSAISSAISAIEDEYQCTLFDRTNKRIHLNETGRLLRDRVEPIIEQINMLANEINLKQLAFRGYLSVGGSFFLASRYLQAVVDETQNKNPELRTENSPLRTAQVIQDVLSGLLDYGLCFSPHGHPSLERNLLYSGELKIVVSKKHPVLKLIHKKEFKLASLNQYPAALHKFAPGIDYCENHPAFEQFGIKPKIDQYFHSDELCIQSVVRRNLWTMIPDVVSDHYRSALVELPLPRAWNAPYEICSIYRKTMKNRSIFSHLDEQLKSSLKKEV